MGKFGKIMKIINADGATPLDPDTLLGLIPKHITTQNQLNEWEAQNIIEARKWAYIDRRTADIFTLKFVRMLHKKMFGNTWVWAGEWRKRQTNIGCDPGEIVSNLYALFDEINHQINGRIYTLNEIAIRLHHKLVSIHPFPNGNGRHARLMTDIFLLDNVGNPFNWGGTNLTQDSDVRKKYLDALRAADNHDFSLLKGFLGCDES